MVCHNSDDLLHNHAIYILSSCKTGCKSWFIQVREICSKYGLPDPLSLLQSPPRKDVFKTLYKKIICEYWHGIFVNECKGMSSLKYFRPELYSLVKPHYMWSTSAKHPFESSKSTIWARMISGRFRTEMFCRHYSNNREGYCLSESCDKVPGTLEHMLFSCPKLSQIRERLYSMWQSKTVMFPTLHAIVRTVLESDEEAKATFFLEPMTDGWVLEDSQKYGIHFVETIAYLTRSFLFHMNREYLRHFKQN